MLEIPTGPAVRGRQLWRRTGNFLLIFLQFYVNDLRFKPWGPTTFFTEFQTLCVNMQGFRWKFMAPSSSRAWNLVMKIAERSSLKILPSPNTSFHSTPVMSVGLEIVTYDGVMESNRMLPDWQLNTLRPRQNGRRFTDDTLKRISLNENVII